MQGESLGLSERLFFIFPSPISGIQMLSRVHRSPTKTPAVFEGIGDFPSSMKNKLMNDPQSSHNKHRIKKKKGSIGFRKGISLFLQTVQQGNRTLEELSASLNDPEA